MADKTQPDAPEGEFTDPEPEVALPEPTPVEPVQVNHFNRRSGDDALHGSFVDVVSGEHKDRRGHYFHDVSHGEDGYPDRVLIRTRDADNLILEVGYSDIRPTPYLGGR